MLELQKKVDEQF